MQKKNTGIPNRLHEKWQNDLNIVIDNDFFPKPSSYPLKTHCSLS